MEFNYLSPPPLFQMDDWCFEQPVSHVDNSLFPDSKINIIKKTEQFASHIFDTQSVVASTTDTGPTSPLSPAADDELFPDLEINADKDIRQFINHIFDNSNATQSFVASADTGLLNPLSPAAKGPSSRRTRNNVDDPPPTWILFPQSVKRKPTVPMQKYLKDWILKSPPQTVGRITARHLSWNH